MNGKIENVCRTCMGEDEHNAGTKFEKRKTISIFNEPESMENSYATIMELLILTTPQLNIEKDDMLPKILCEYCVEKLVKVHEFQQMSIRVEHRLRDIINQQTIGINQNNDPLKESAATQTFSDLNSLLKIEMDEPLIDPDDIINDCDGMNYNCTSSDNDSEWEPLSNFINSNKNSIDTLKEELEETSAHRELSENNSSNEITKKEHEFECEECGNRLKTKKSLRRHKLIHLRPQIKDDVPDNLDDTLFVTENQTSPTTTNVKRVCQSYVDKSSYQFGCDECGGRLKSLKSLKRHKLIHLRPHVKKDEPEHLSEKLTETDAQSKSIIPEIKFINHNYNDKSLYQFECDECGNRLKTRKSLKKHKRIHLRPPGAQKEKQPRIATETMYQCEYCKKDFQRSSSLKEHIRLHTGEKPYLCSECGKSFRKSSNLKQHLLRHSSDKPYVCADCPKCFLTLSDLASHRAVHIKSKAHVCDVCGAGFGKPYLLKAHKMYHTGEKNHKCEYCDRRFVTGDQCKRHMRTHTGEKPYKCKYCDRAFAQSNDLMKHLKSHLGDNVYKCSLCPLGFRLHSDLREHFNTHKHDDEETKLRNLEALKEEEMRLQIKFGLIGST